MNLPVVLSVFQYQLKICSSSKDRHLNFFESMIQANKRKEAENIPLIAFQFWSNENIAEQLESETLKFLYSDLSSVISECQTGIIPLILAIIKVKKAIDLFPRFAKKKKIS